MLQTPTDNTPWENRASTARRSKRLFRDQEEGNLFETTPLNVRCAHARACLHF
ncbi:hypothetical protein JB92DRAFT_3032742 [Gautieria morchelliformis]|nr:hypothetical protein JB92DRAFT_3032742 [Gautieria morchelliformis]